MDEAKDFQLEGQEGEMFRLSEHRGKRVLLSFHPLAWTEICAQQMLSLEKNKERFDELNTIAVGLSVDAKPSKKAWADSLEIKKIQILADFWPHGGVAKLYGLFREKNGFSERANVIVNEEGRIIFRKVYDIRTLPDIEEIIAFLQSH